jgi:hypothetical protein
MKHGNDLLLQAAVEIDQQVAAGDRIQMGKGRILGQILLGKHDHFANGFDHLNSVVRGNEILIYQFRIHVHHSG